MELKARDYLQRSNGAMECAHNVFGAHMLGCTFLDNLKMHRYVSNLCMMYLLYEILQFQGIKRLKATGNEGPREMS